MSRYPSRTVAATMSAVIFGVVMVYSIYNNRKMARIQRPERPF